MRNALDTLCPDGLVKLGIEADVLGAHRLLCEVDYRLDGMRGPLLEGATVYELVQVDGVFTGDDVLEGRTCLAGLIWCIARMSTKNRGGQPVSMDAPSKGVLTHLFGGSLGGLITCELVKVAATTSTVTYHFLRMSGSMSSEGR